MKTSIRIIALSVALISLAHGQTIYRLDANDVIDPTFLTTANRQQLADGAGVTQVANARAPRNGVAFDGTANARLYSTLTGQNIGTDVFSVALSFIVPSANPTQTCGLAYLGSSSTTRSTDNTIQFNINTDGTLSVFFRADAAANNYVSWVRQIVTSYGGKTVNLIFVRNSTGNPTILVDGSDITSSGSFTTVGTGSWQQSVTTTYFAVGYLSANEVATTSINSATLYNLALSASEAAEIYALGGAVPARYQWGSQSIFTGGDFASATGWTVGTTWSIAGGKAVATNSYYDGLYKDTSVAFVNNGVYRTRYTISNHTSGYFQACGTLGGAFVQWGAGRNANGTYEDTLITGILTAGPQKSVGVRGLSANSTADIDDFSIVKLGAVAHFPLNEGAGYQPHDESTNKLDAVITTTGAAYLMPNYSGFVRASLTWAGTHEAKSLLGQAALPSNAVITSIITTATAGSSGSGLTVGSVTTPALFVAANTFTTAKESHALSTPFPAGTAANDLNVVLDPDTANYTGTIQVTINYLLAN